MIGNDESVHGGITTVINQFRNNDWNKKDINFKFIPTYKEGNAIKKVLFFLIAYLKIICYCIKNRTNIIHIHMSYKGSFSRAYCIHKLCRILKIKDIIHLHGSEFKKWYDEGCNKSKKKKVKRLLKECSKIIVLGKEWEKRILAIEPSSKTVIVNNTVEVPINYEKKINYESLNILFLGVLIKRKGIFDLISAISELNKKIDLKDVKFIIAGSGNEEENVKAKAKELNVDKYIHFTGWIDVEQKKELLKKSQLLILPSYNEGLPMAILEAMSYGLPIIATNVGDIPEAVINEENGFLIEPGNIEMLVDSILNVINLTEEEWKQYSENSKKIVSQKFSDVEYFKKIETIYKTI